MEARWDALPADALRLVLSLLDVGDRAACRAVSSSWRRTSDDSSEVWGLVASRRPTAAVGGTDRPLATPQLMAALLHRQRAHLRKLHLELGCVADEGAAAGATDDADALALVLAAACSEGSALTDLTLAVSKLLPDCIMEVRCSWGLC